MSNTQGEFGLWSLSLQQFTETGMTFDRANHIAAHERDDVYPREVCPDHGNQPADECRQCPPDA